MANIAERLKELRTEAGLKQEELGEMIGVQRMTSYRWENGSNPPSNENLLLLAQLFNTSTLYLRGDIDDRDMVLTSFSRCSFYRVYSPCNKHRYPYQVAEARNGGSSIADNFVYESKSKVVIMRILW